MTIRTNTRFVPSDAEKFDGMNTYSGMALIVVEGSTPNYLGKSTFSEINKVRIMTTRNPTPIEKSSRENTFCAALPTSQMENRCSDPEFALTPNNQVPYAAFSSEGSAIPTNAPSVTSYANEKQAYSLSYAAGTSPIVAVQNYANPTAVVGPTEHNSGPFRGEQNQRSSVQATRMTSASEHDYHVLVPVVPIPSTNHSSTDEAQMVAYSSEFGGPYDTSCANLQASNASRTDHDILQAVVINDTDSFTLPPPPGIDGASDPPKGYNKVVIPCLVGFVCVVVLVAIIVPIVVIKSSSSNASGSATYFAKYDINWQVEIVGGSLFYYGSNALEITCLNGWTISDAKVTSLDSGVSPTCSRFDSSLTCERPGSATIDTGGSVLNAIIAFTCSGNSHEELLASATMAAQSMNVQIGVTASHFLTLSIYDSAGSGDSSGGQCPSEYWSVLSDSTTWICSSSASCADLVCTLNLASLTLSQGSPIASEYIQSN